MAIGFAAQYTEIVPFAANPQTAIQTAKAALQELGLRHTQPDSQTLRAKININPLSWGEILHISIEAPDQLRIQSHCTSQLFDWNKNKRWRPPLPPNLHPSSFIPHPFSPRLNHPTLRPKRPNPTPTSTRRIELRTRKPRR